MKKILLMRYINYLVLVWSLLAGYFAFTDMQISASFVNESSGWANFLERFGEIPGLLVLFSGTHIYLADFLSELKIKKILTGIFLFAAVSYLLRHMLMISYYGITGSNKVLTSNNLAILTAILLVNLIIIGIMRRSQFPMCVKKYAKASVLLGLYGYLFLVQPMKHLWGRVRFRDLDPVYSDFSEWFVMNGINGNESFPSGHSAMAWMILPLFLLFVNKNKTLQIIMVAFISGWGVVVGLSRVLIGAHYASDVLFGAFIIIITFLVIYKKFILTGITKPEIN
jgi:membrane-associated phospholipid phosphatase